MKALPEILLALIFLAEVWWVCRVRYKDGFQRGYESGRKDADNWCIEMESEVEREKIGRREA
jgi:hypothetical protein